MVGGGAAETERGTGAGRAGRCALVLDAGHPRNQPSPRSHGVFTRDGTPPSVLLRLARAQLARYPSVELRKISAVSARPAPGGFVIRGPDDTDVRGRRILLAVGVRNELPPSPRTVGSVGYRRAALPFCHGWEVRRATRAIYARGRPALGMVTLLLGWGHDLRSAPTGGSLEQQRDELDAQWRPDLRPR